MADNTEESAVTTLDLSQARVYRVPGAVAGVLASALLDFRLADVTFVNPVPLHDDRGRLIGFAHIWRNGSYLHADLALDYSTPERLVLETKSFPLYLHVFGTMLFGSAPFAGEQGAIDLVGTKRVVASLTIEALVLSRQQTRNHDLPPVGDT